jgi:hypothetical protein
MKTQAFLEHHGIVANPFAEEDAQTDPVFKEHCIDGTYHPAWDKVYGNPSDPATSIVLGEKGAGKTAMRLQIARHLAQHNKKKPDARVFVIEYDDFNPFLDNFADKLSVRKRQSPAKVLDEWKLWDHMDAILSLGVTQLVDAILGETRRQGDGANEVTDEQCKRLDRHQARDVLLLAACYDKSASATFKSRWRRLRRKLRFSTWRARWDKALGVAVTAAVAAVIVYWRQWTWLQTPWPYLISAAGWVAYLARTWIWCWRARAIVRNVRSGNHQTNALRQVLMSFPASDIQGQPLPNSRRTDDRYELLMKLQGVLETFGFKGVVVLVDRVDEPHMINGSVELMRELVWSMLDNKFLKHPGMGIKILAPIELGVFLEREERDFYQRARLDKQNLVPSLEWTAQALLDVANARIRACAATDAEPSLRRLFDVSISDQRLLEALRGLRVPRHLFKFLYRLLVAHCNAHTDADPAWTISSSMFESTLALYSREQDAVDRGLRAG